MRVLIVEDSRRIRETTAKGLRRAGLIVDTAEEGEEGLWKLRSGEYDAVVLDLMMPGMDGWEVLERLRSEGNEVPVLILTARDGLDEKVRGLGVGADDYLTKPFHFEELKARLEALGRRRRGITRNVLEAGPLRMDLGERRVWREGEEIDLNPREFNLLRVLMLRPGEVLSRTEIEQAIYDDRAEPMSNVVNASISILRSRLDREGEPSLVETRRGMGYLLRVTGGPIP